MSAASLARYFYYSRLAHPPHERLIYRCIRRHLASRLLVLGVGDVHRSIRMIEVALRHSPNRAVDYTGVDLFEAREGSALITLKAAYRKLAATGARVRLLPGDPFTVLARHANSLLATDLLIISADQTAQDMDRAWFYVPRMLHENSVVLSEGRGHDGHSLQFRALFKDEVEAAAQKAERCRRLAA